MEIAGIVCEYNPVHFGHAYHIAETRRILGEDTAVVCVMSGSFVQRGEPAVFRKHARARAAIACGADLVLELPLPWAISSAERFAFGGAALLDSLGVCTHISFGSECGEISRLRAAAECVLLPETEAMTREALKSGISYAAARASAVESLAGDAGVLASPNDTLAVEYLKALSRLGSRLSPLAVKRVGDAHDGGLSSASAVRERLRRGEAPWEHMPKAAAAAFEEEVEAGRGPVTVEALETAILARLRAMTDEQFAALPDASEGLERRFLRAARSEPDVMSVLAAVKTKRYALSRIRRMLMAAYLGVEAGDADGAPPYARVLAADELGRSVLAAASEAGSVPVLTKPAAIRSLSSSCVRVFEKEALATELYSLAYRNVSERRGGAEWRISPVML